MPSEYWYYYFAVKKDRNEFVSLIDDDERLATAGVRVVNKANDVGGHMYLAVLSFRGVSGCRDIVDGHFAGLESGVKVTVCGSPHDFSL